jgi:hypothetical protein
MYLNAMQEQQNVIDHGASCTDAGLVGPSSFGQAVGCGYCRRSRVDSGLLDAAYPTSQNRDVGHPGFMNSLPSAQAIRRVPGFRQADKDRLRDPFQSWYIHNTSPPSAGFINRNGGYSRNEDAFAGPSL